MAHSALMAIAVICLTLTHELVAFFAFYFVLAVYLRFGNARHAILSTLPVPMAGLLTLLLLFMFGGLISDWRICEAIILQGADAHVCGGIMKVTPLSIRGALGVLITELGYQHLGKLVLSALLGFLPVLVLFDMDERRKIRPVACFYALAFFISLPLYLTAIDWGRWTHIHFILLTLSLFALPDNGNVQAVVRASPRRLYGKTVVVAGAFLLLTSMMWKMTHCCSESFINTQENVAMQAVGYIKQMLAVVP